MLCEELGRHADDGETCAWKTTQRSAQSQVTIDTMHEAKAGLLVMASTDPHSSLYQKMSKKSEMSMVGVVIAQS
mgnify:CR=1 FL=1